MIFSLQLFCPRSLTQAAWIGPTESDTGHDDQKRRKFSEFP